MAVKKVFTDYESELEIILSENFQCIINIESKYNNGSIMLDSDDLTELISELISIKKQIDRPKSEPILWHDQKEIM